MTRPYLFLLVLILCPSPVAVRADADSARLAMANPENPLLLIVSSAGSIYIEMLPNEAPANVANFIRLVAGDVTIPDPDSGRNFSPRYFDGMRFHRVIPGFIIQAGSPSLHPLGQPGRPLADEINADLLGLDHEPVMDERGHFNPRLNIADKKTLHEQLLAPLYRRMAIDNAEELLQRQEEVISRLQQMTVKQAYENLGYRYRDDLPGRAVDRGVVALANTGPDGNGPEFFIALREAPWLSGRHTIIGRVVEGMETADSIGAVAVDPLGSRTDSTRIYSIRRVD